MPRKNKAKSADTASAKPKKKYHYPPRDQRTRFSRVDVQRAVKAARRVGCEPVRLDFHKDGVFSLVLADAKTASGDTMASISEAQLKELL